MKRLNGKSSISKKLSLGDSNRGMSVDQEDKFACIVGGRRVIGSGSIEGILGDVRSRHWLFELKFTRSDRYYLSVDTVSKIEREAMSLKLNYALAVSLLGIEKRDHRNWIIIPCDDSVDSLLLCKKKIWGMTFIGERGFGITKSRIDSVMSIDCGFYLYISDYKLEVMTLDHFLESYHV